MTDKLLVTGIGGDLSQAVVKALRLAPHSWEIIGVDMQDSPVGRSYCHAFHTVPKAVDPAYLVTLLGIARQHGVTTILPATEYELRVLTPIAASLERDHGVRLIALPGDWFARHNDKLLTFESLRGQVPLGDFADGADHDAVRALVRRVGFPLIVKERRSSGSRGIALVRDEAALWAAIGRAAAPIAQEFLDGEDAEFSVCVFAAGPDRRAIALRRKLGPVGATWFATVDQNAEVLEYCIAASQALAQNSGSANYQLRLTSKGPRLLEINPRFSSLVAARAAANFPDVYWSILQATGEPLPPPEPVRFVRFARYFAEVIDYGAGFGTCPEWAVPPVPPLKSND